MKNLVLWMAMAAAAVGGSASASSISGIGDIDLTALSFEVDAGYSCSAGSATGTSNGIGFTIDYDGIFCPFSNDDNAVYNDLPGAYDALHLSADFSITFDTEVSAVLMALSNDNSTGDGPDFGMLPTDSSGITLDGTHLSITDIGGALALFAFGTPTSTLSHTDTKIGDGWDVSFFAYAMERPEVVPLPAAGWLLMVGLFTMAALRRRN